MRIMEFDVPENPQNPKFVFGDPFTYNLDDANPFDQYGGIDPTPWAYEEALCHPTTYHTLDSLARDLLACLRGYSRYRNDAKWRSNEEYNLARRSHIALLERGRLRYNASIYPSARYMDFAVWMEETQELEERPWVRNLFDYFRRLERAEQKLRAAEPFGLADSETRNEPKPAKQFDFTEVRPCPVHRPPLNTILKSAKNQTPDESGGESSNSGSARGETIEAHTAEWLTVSAVARKVQEAVLPKKVSFKTLKSTISRRCDKLYLCRGKGRERRVHPSVVDTLTLEITRKDLDEENNEYGDE